MESSRWRRGLKGKLVVSFCKPPKPSPTPHSGKVKPAPASTAVGYVADSYPAPQHGGMAKPVVAAPTASVGYVANDFPATPPRVEKVHILRAGARWDMGDGDENVDRMAESYISRIQERFRMEQND